MDNKKVLGLFQQLTDFSFFEGTNTETAYIEKAFDIWLNQQIEKFKFINEVENRFKTLESIEIPSLPFNDTQIKALQVLANAALGNKPEVIEEKQEVTDETSSEPMVKKVRRGRKTKIETEIEAHAAAPLNGAIPNIDSDDEYMDSTVPMRDPKTGLQMVDEDGKPMWLRVKKNPVKTVVPAGYKPPPPAHVSNMMAAQEGAANFSKAQNFKLPGSSFTFADLINNAKK